jgi:hypothetical protein
MWKLFFIRLRGARTAPHHNGSNQTIFPTNSTELFFALTARNRLCTIVLIAGRAQVARGRGGRDPFLLRLAKWITRE